MLIDVHNHLQDERFDGNQDALIADMKKVGVSHCVVNGTKQGDWPRVAKLSQRNPNFVWPSFGLHPWQVKGRAESARFGFWLH